MELYKDKSAPIEARVKDLMSRMTREEKIGQMLQLPAKQGIVEENYIDKMDDWHIGSFLHCTGKTIKEIQEKAATSRLGIPVLFGVDAIHGHCFDDKGTVFPTQLAMSCSWNPELLSRMAHVTAKEVRAGGMHWTFSPVLCLGRDTRWGRIDETFGEDPWLSGELGMAMVDAYQGNSQNNLQNILACPKHYVAYGESTGGRDSYESEVSLRKLKSIFLPPFEKVITQSGAATIMTAYQAIDGIPATSSQVLLKDILKREWGFEGMVVTDWDNIGSLVKRQSVSKSTKEATLDGIKGGNDMFMSTDTVFDDAMSLICEGRLMEEDLDDSVARILRLKFKLGLFDEYRFVPEDLRENVTGIPSHWETSLELSRQSLTLLVNKENALPFNELSGKKILLTGPNADDVIAQLGDWSFGSMQAGAVDTSYHRKDTVTLLDGLKDAAEEKGFQLDYLKGCDIEGDHNNSILQAAKKAESADYVVLCVGDTLEQHGEGRDRSDLTLSGKQMDLFRSLRKAARHLTVIFMASKPLAIQEIKEECDALICCFNPGAKGGTAIAEALTGELNPSGKLTISFPYSAGQLPVYYSKYKGWHSADEQGREKYFDIPEDPVFSFGEGLSYTQFIYSDLQVLTPEITHGENPVFSIKLKNTGSRWGTEITQLYINDLVSSVTTPAKLLKGFQRTELAPGEEALLEFNVDYRELSLVTSDLERLVEAGDFEVMIGGSSKESDLHKGYFTVLKGGKV